MLALFFFEFLCLRDEDLIICRYDAQTLVTDFFKPKHCAASHAAEGAKLYRLHHALASLTDTLSHLRLHSPEHPGNYPYGSPNNWRNST